MKKSEVQALILRTKEVSDANKLVFLFTRERGKVKAMAYGARKLKNRFGSALEPFTYARSMLVHKRTSGGMESLDAVDIISSSFDLYSDYVVSSYLYYYAELLDAVLPEEQQEDNIFRLALEMVRGFKEGLNPLQVGAYFELWLLRLLGVLPDYKLCHICSAALKKTKEIFISSEGYLFCGDCRTKDANSGAKAPSGFYDLLTLMFKSKIDKVYGSFEPIVNLSILTWTDNLFRNVLGRELRSYRNLKEVREYRKS